MKTTLVLLLILIVSPLFAQTDSLEIAALYNKLVYKQIDPNEFAKIKGQWEQKLKTTEYPEQPVDRNGEVHYVFVNEYSGLNREYLFNRTLEWLSINYGLIPSSLYSNSADGKIIFRNSMVLYKNYSIIPTTIISVKDDKIRIELISITYQVYNRGDYSSGIPESYNDVSIYPVILKKNTEWNMNMYLLSETGKLFSREAENLKEYIQSYETSNIF